jgi:uncharacterized protein (TIGR00730 family)
MGEPTTPASPTSDSKARTAICVFAGTGRGAEKHRDAARTLGGELAHRGLRLVYGGAGDGLMGLVADAALAAGAEVTGVTLADQWPTELDRGDLTELHSVADPQERKVVMVAAADAVVALPGGVGTLDELFDVLALADLGLHQKPIGVLNAGDYYDQLFGLLRRGQASGLVSPGTIERLHHAPDAATLLDRLGLGLIPVPSESRGAAEPAVTELSAP